MNYYVSRIHLPKNDLNRQDEEMHLSLGTLYLIYFQIATFFIESYGGEQVINQIAPEYIITSLLCVGGYCRSALFDVLINKDIH